MMQDIGYGSALGLHHYDKLFLKDIFLVDGLRIRSNPKIEKTSTCRISRLGPMVYPNEPWVCGDSYRHVGVYNR